jgi:hypothetical protein
VGIGCSFLGIDLKFACCFVLTCESEVYGLKVDSEDSNADKDEEELAEYGKGKRWPGSRDFPCVMKLALKCGATVTVPIK